MTKILIASDLHSEEYPYLHQLPECDIYIDAGDFTNKGNRKQFEQYNDFLYEIPAKHKICSPGNHDFMAEVHREATQLLMPNGDLCIHESRQIDELSIFCSPYQPWFYGWAFNLHRGPEIAAKWEDIPYNLDILVTHGPPFGIRDWVGRSHVGCEDLMRNVKLKKPRVHIFGHIHHGYGVTERDGTIFINAALVNNVNEIDNSMILLDIDNDSVKVDYSTVKRIG